MQRTKLLVVLAVFALTLTSIGQKIYQGDPQRAATHSYMSAGY